jgi:hypothetical protein
LFSRQRTPVQSCDYIFRCGKYSRYYDPQREALSRAARSSMPVALGSQAFQLALNFGRSGVARTELSDLSIPLNK